VRTVLLMQGKSPRHVTAGDTLMSSLLHDLAREAYSVSTVSLSDRGDASGDGWVEISKPRVEPLRLSLRSLRTGRSLVHERFDVAALRSYLADTDFDRYVAEHSYMAEAYVGVRGAAAAAAHLCVNTHVDEAYIWSTEWKGRLLPNQVRRLAADQLRVARVARRVGCFDIGEAESYSRRGVADATWLDLSLPPSPRVDPGAAGPALLFLGHLDWSPNRSAVRRLSRIWPRVRQGAPEARLLLVGNGRPPSRLAAGIQSLGFVPDLGPVLASSRGLLAPLEVGGGVRVKILEAAAYGLPVIGSRTAIGSLSGMFGLRSADSDEEIVHRSLELLSSPRTAAAEGLRLHEVCRTRWEDRLPHQRVADWLA
jgi:glycosyltransferase involved in cell wall biosynthesis